MRHKYSAKNCREIDPTCGRHASLKEHRRYCELVLLERAGEVRHLREQVAFELLPKQELFGKKLPAVRYFADFVYHERRTVDGRDVYALVVEDSKGIQTPQFRLKARLLKKEHGVEVRLS